LGAGKLYAEFIRIDSLSVGVYVLPASGKDPQLPHREDEVYYVVKGRATAQVAGEDRPVGPGSVLLVKAAVPHHFHHITEDVTLLVFFAPAESAV
jgi:mannose-6-phosphate isomerase-like protein (cupin superfamily)